MATGVEMLGQMSEDISLAGPVEGGNMVVKPNEAPVGAAALLSKQLRNQANKGVAGIYELPTPQENIPEFMKMAQANVKMQGDPMRGMGPREGLTPFDIANMSGAVEQAGILNFLGLQPEVTVPIRAKSHADAPSTQLAYITDAEKQMLIDANMHGSLDGEPNPGPGGVQSLDDFYTYTDKKGKTQVGGGGGEAVSAWESAGMPSSGTTQEGGYQSSEDFYAEKVAEDPDWGKNNQHLLGTDTSTLDDLKTVLDSKDKKEETKQTKEQQELLDELNTLNDQFKDGTIDKDGKKRIKAINKKLKKLFDEQQKTLFEDTKTSLKDMDADTKKKRFSELFQKAQYGGQLTSAEKRELKALRDDKTSNMYFKGINALDDVLGEMVDADVDDIMSPNTMALVAHKKGLLGEDGKLTAAGQDWATKYGDEIEFLGIDDFGSYLEGIKGGVEGTESQRAIDKIGYYTDSDKAKYYGSGSTMGNLEQLAGEALFKKQPGQGLTAEQEKFNRRVIEARGIVNQNKDRNRGNRGGGGGGGPRPPKPIEEEQVSIVEQEDLTMPYKGPRTGDKEQQVPLGRRFTTDPTKKVAQYTTTPRTQEEIYKYMTEGTTGEGIGLEPFGEYQRRRRKALGLDPLDLWG